MEKHRYALNSEVGETDHYTTQDYYNVDWNCCAVTIKPELWDYGCLG